MNEIKFVIGILLVLVFYIFLTKIFMNFANYIGEKLGLGKFFTNLLLRNKDAIDNKSDQK